MKKELYILLLSLLLIGNVFGQVSKSNFYPEANGTVYKREKVNALAFNTTNSVDSFFKILTKRFGSPLTDKSFIIYKCFNKKWSNERIILRLQHSIDIESDNSRSNSIFIYAETKSHKDLLEQNTPSNKKITSYFLILFNGTIKNGRADTFEYN